MNEWLTPLEILISWTFVKLDFSYLKALLLYPEFQKRIFPGWICPNTTNERENGHFLPKTMDKPLWKNLNFSTFWSSCFYSLERCFFVLGYRKTDFSWPILRKIKRRKNGQFCEPKPWTNPFGKFGFFWTFLKLDISCLESVLFYPEYKINDVFWLDLPKNNQREKWPFLTKNRKTWLFLSKNHSFLSRISKDDLFWLDWLKYHHWKKGAFLQKTKD